MVNGTGLTPGPTAGLGGGIMRQRLVSTASWQKWGGMQKVTERGLVRRSKVDESGERKWKHS